MTLWQAIFAQVFGSTIHLSQRLESNCPRGQIACCSGFASQLGQQAPMRQVSRKCGAIPFWGARVFVLLFFLKNAFMFRPKGGEGNVGTTIDRHLFFAPFWPVPCR